MDAKLFTKGKEHILRGEVDLQNGNISILLVDSTYAIDLALHESLVSVPEEAIIAAETLNNTSISDGVFDADDVTFTDVTGSPVYHILIVHEGVSYSQSWLIAAYTSSTTPLVTPDGSAVTIQWNSGVNKIFSI